MISAAIAVVTGAGSGGQSSGATHLSGSDKAWLLAVIAAFVLLAGVVVIIGRKTLEGKSPAPAQSTTADGASAAPSSSLVRSWIAVSLVGGLLIFVAASFWLDDTTLRSTLVGGVVANAGAAVAFYFASQSADQARKDILNASLPSTLVPDLAGMDQPAAQAAIAATPLSINVQPPNPAEKAQVVAQTPAPNEPVIPGTAVIATFAGPVPALVGMTAQDAQSALAAVGLKVDVPSPAPDETALVTSQNPEPASRVPTDRTVHVSFG
jgi:hypothetical protein